MKRENCGVMAIIATAHKRSKIVRHTLHDEMPFEIQRMTDPKLRRITRGIQAGRPTMKAPDVVGRKRLLRLDSLQLST